MGLLSRLFPARRRTGREDAPRSILGYCFRDPRLLEIALTHRSYANSVAEHPTYERLEFLGDSVLGMVVARHLFLAYPDESEGQLTKLKASLVNLKTLTAVARREGLGQHVKLSPEEDKAGGRRRGSILSDVFEAVIGAVYIDGGIDTATDLIERVLIRELEKEKAPLLEVNFKGELLEYLQGRGLGMPRYETVNESGPDHEKVFTIVVHADGKCIGRGVGSNKKDAEQQAAREALRGLDVLKDVMADARALINSGDRSSHPPSGRKQKGTRPRKAAGTPPPKRH
ncbi:MAG TPA: ribonuclease III [Acidobacteriota bacterium]|nr:ribonuclease III [Acidobacteriota bacterium]